MEKIKVLAAEVAKCRGKGGQRVTGFPKSLKKRICAAAKKYGLSTVANVLGMSRSLIGGWNGNYPLNRAKKKGPPINNLPIVFQEILPKANELSTRPFVTEAPLLKLTSPSGFCIEITGHYGAETGNIIKAFMGGQS